MSLSILSGCCTQQWSWCPVLSGPTKIFYLFPLKLDSAFCYFNCRCPELPTSCLFFILIIKFKDISLLSLAKGSKSYPSGLSYSLGPNFIILTCPKLSLEHFGILGFTIPFAFLSTWHIAAGPLKPIFSTHIICHLAQQVLNQHRLN